MVGLHNTIIDYVHCSDEHLYAKLPACKLQGWVSINMARVFTWQSEKLTRTQDGEASVRPSSTYKLTQLLMCVKPAVLHSNL